MGRMSWRLFRERIKKSLGTDDRSRALLELVSQANPKDVLEERSIWLANLIRWLKGDGDAEKFSVRIRYLAQFLDRNPEWKLKTQATLVSTIEDLSFLEFFSETGHSAEHGFWTDLVHRFVVKWLPSTSTGDFQSVLGSALHEEHDVEWARSVRSRLLVDLLSILDSDQRTRVQQSLALEVREALLLLAANVVHHGLAPEIRSRSTHPLAASIRDSSFVRLSAELHELLHGEDSRGRSDAVLKAVDECQFEIAQIYLRLEQQGVSVSLVYKLELLTGVLGRIRLLVELKYSTSDETNRARLIKRLFADAARVTVRKQSIRDHIQEHLYLLSRKISERNGHSGEHYVVRDHSQRSALFLSAMGGGVIVVLMTLGKLGLYSIHLAPLFHAFGIWILYSGGFLAMQAMGFTLATKVPSFTANHLAKQIKAVRTRAADVDFSREVGLIFGSQALALVGNVATVVPFALGMGWLLSTQFPSIALDSAKALHSLEELSPLKGGVFVLGALTGVQLWISSLCGGWFENWVVYRRIPEAIEHHPGLRSAFGADRMKRLADLVLAQSSGVATNIALGFTFGFIPLLGAGLGLNLDSKHVTISTATAVLSWATLGDLVQTALWVPAVLGLLVVGVMNVSVSFAIALDVAARAQKLKRVWVWYFITRGRRRGRSLQSRKSTDAPSHLSG